MTWLTFIVQKFSTPLPTFSPLFSSPNAAEALEHAIALHFFRTGRFDTAKTFLAVRHQLFPCALVQYPSQESSADIAPELHARFFDLHRILTALRYEDVRPALEYALYSPITFTAFAEQWVQVGTDK
jgi:hypothetical protein